MTQQQLQLYNDLAEWFTTLTRPEDYAEEAALYHQVLQAESESEITTLLELGAGAGNNASHLKKHYQMTLTDLSPAMLDQSKKQNPECEHHVGDMRTIRINRQFDAVFIHDAIDYMTTLEDLTSALKTAAGHCKPGGIVLVVPDYVRETFHQSTSHGGHDEPKSLRYLEWTWQPEGHKTTYFADFSYLLRDGLETHAIYERHVCGLFSKYEWLSAFSQVGLQAKMTQSSIEGDVGTYQAMIFIARKMK